MELNAGNGGRDSPTFIVYGGTRLTYEDVLGSAFDGRTSENPSESNTGDIARMGS
jgi:hypothetical protein